MFSVAPVLDLRQCKMQYTIQKMIVTLETISFLFFSSLSLFKAANGINSDLHTINVFISIGNDVKGNEEAAENE